jgi:hypothetical protein
MPDGLFVDLLDDSYDLIVTGLPARSPIGHRHNIELTVFSQAGPCHPAP